MIVAVPLSKFSPSHIIVWMMAAAQSEYETAMVQSLGRESVTVKVKQFSLRGARIGAETSTVHYSNEPTSRVFIVISTYGGKPIKISAPSKVALNPVEEAIRRALNVRAPFDPQR